jgi:hypothetical protein
MSLGCSDSSVKYMLTKMHNGAGHGGAHLDLSTQEAEAGGYKVQDQPGREREREILPQNKNQNDV